VIVEVDNRTAVRVDEAAIAALVERVIEQEGAGDAEAGVMLVEPAEMRRLNAEYRRRDEVTDVLAFPIDEDDDLPVGVPRLLGDVVICLARTEEQADEAGHGRGVELAVLAVHGTLHLLGHDHETDNGEMLALQDRICATVGPIGWDD
jgi:probable rRNA maturation factor